MRVVMIAAAVAACGGCSRAPISNTVGNGAPVSEARNASVAPFPSNVASANAAHGANAAATARASSAALPAGFPSRDATEFAASCVVFLGLSRTDRANAVGHDDVAMTQAQDQARAALRLTMSADEANQLVGSSVNPLSSTPSAQRDAASRYCVENAPEPDPDAR